MSLINQMLKDLQQRDDASAGLALTSDELRVVSVVKRYRSTSLVIFLAGILISGAATWLYMTPVQLAFSADASLPAVDIDVDKEGAGELNLSETSSAEVDPSELTLPELIAPERGTPQRVLSAPLALSLARIDRQSTPPVVTPKPVQSSERNSLVLPANALSKVKILSTEVSPAPLAPGKTRSTIQQSDNLYRQSLILLRQGRVDETQQVLRKSLVLNVYNLKARQALVGLLLDSNNIKEATESLIEGLSLSPKHSVFSMALARLQLESGDSSDARDTLGAGLFNAGEEPNYHAFYAAVLQRDEQHNMAIQHYLIALGTKPSMATWLVGLGISLQASGKFNDASSAYQRARDTGQLTPQLTQFIESRLGHINQISKP